jgi:hypothetical protein
MRIATRISTRSRHKCGVWTETAGRTLCRMEKITQLEILARAFLGGLVERHGREHAAHILARLAEGLRAGLPIGAQCRRVFRLTRRLGLVGV